MHNTQNKRILSNLLSCDWLRKTLIFIAGLMLSVSSFGQVTWDGGGDGTNWSSANNWNPNGVPTAGQTVTISVNSSENINVDGNYTCAGLSLALTGNNNGNRTVVINIPSGNTFTVNGTINIDNTSTRTFRTKTLTLDVAGTLNANGGISMTSTSGDNNKVSSLSITGGTVNCTGDITMNAPDPRNDVTFSTGTLNLTGGISGGALNAGTGTVNYYNSGAQNIGAYTYYNLTTSNGGIKALTGAVTVNNILNLSSGVLQLGANDLTVADGASVSGTYSVTNMIETNSTGNLIKQGNASSDYTMVFPLGSGGYYTPMQVANAVVAGVGDITARAVPSQRDVSYTNSLNKYWSVSSTNVTSADLSFTYDPAEVNGTQSNYNIRRYSGGTFFTPPSPSAAGANPMSSTGANPLTGDWTALDVTIPDTYYSYQSGNWDVPSTWTTDPGGTTQQGTTVPDTGDIAIILPGRTVSLPSDITTPGMDITIEDGGFVDMSTYSFTNTLTALRGAGTLKLESVNFPTVTLNTFVNTGGGTTEYYNASDFTLPASQSTYNNLTINASGVIATQLSDITLNGDLHIKQGSYRINDNSSTTKLNLTINGDVTVDSGASITVGNGSTNGTTTPTGITGGTAPYLNYYEEFHRVVVAGDFTNNGTVRFTNLNYPVYDAFPSTSSGATSGAASVYFTGASDNTLTCNSTTDFYNLIVDKGVDQTYKLTVYSSAYANFRLFGANISGGDSPGNNPNLKKALWIRTGTLELKGLTVIPSLSEGTDNVSSPNSDFYIPANAALVLNGPDVAVFGTADDYAEVNAAYGVSGGTGLVNGVGVGGYSAISILGKLEVDDGYLSTKESSGFITQDWASGQFEINGGTVDAKQIRAAGGSSGLASYDQSGGTVILRGRFQRTPSSYSSVSDLINAPINTVRANIGSLDGTVGTMNINSADNVFTMSGGTIKIYDACDVGGKILDIFSSSSNINVTGGTVEIIPTTGTGVSDAATFYIASNAEIGNLIINRASGSTGVNLNTYDLEVLQDFTLQSGTFDANNLDVTIGGDFTIENGTTYTTGTNWTSFNGSGTQTFTVNLAGALSLSKFKIDKTASEDLVFAGSQKTINVSDSLMLIDGGLDDNGNTINASGSYLYNSGNHYGTGKIVLNGTGTQTITGDGTGIFQNLELNNTNAAAAPVSSGADLTIN